MTRAGRFRQRGAAILAAMLTVTLVASFAAAAMWQQWRSVEVEAAERTRVQASWILTGALDWARLILREDSRSGGADHLAEPWAVPLQEARLSSFLSADSGVSSAPSLVDNVFLSGQITDQESMLNVGNLVVNGSIVEKQLQSFEKLFTLLGLPAGQLGTMVENLRFASDISTDNKSASQAPLAPQKVDELVWLGLPPSTVAALLPYVTVLPASNTRVNLNTASAEVIAAAVEGLALAEAQRLVSARERAPFKDVPSASEVLGDKKRLVDENRGEKLSVTSNYFEVQGRLRVDSMVLHERSLLQRSGTTILVLQRERSAENLGAQIAQSGRR